jgi:hypothetical protein
MEFTLDCNYTSKTASPKLRPNSKPCLREILREHCAGLEGVQKEMSVIFKVDDYVQEGACWSLYNCTTLLFSACRRLRGSVFAKETTRFLAFSILCMEHCSPYLYPLPALETHSLQRTGRVYEQLGATKVITYTLQKIQLLKEIEAAEVPRRNKGHLEYQENALDPQSPRVSTSYLNKLTKPKTGKS